MIGKHFDRWNNKKKELDAKVEEPLYFKQGEIWWVHLGINIGFEANGKGDEFMRPVIILKKYNKFSFLALPLSTSPKTNSYRISIGIVDGKEATANLSQIRNIDSKRLINKVDHLEENKFLDINKKAKEINFL